MKKTAIILAGGLLVLPHYSAQGAWQEFYVSSFLNSAAVTTITSQDYVNVRSFTLPGFDAAESSVSRLGTLTGNVRIGWKPDASFNVDYVQPTATFTSLGIRGLLADASYSMSFNNNAILQQSSKLGEVLFPETYYINNPPKDYTLTHENSTFDDVYGRTHWEFNLRQDYSSLPGWPDYGGTHGYRSNSQEANFSRTSIPNSNFQVQVTTQTSDARFATNRLVLDQYGRLQNEIELFGTVPAAAFFNDHWSALTDLTTVSVSYEYDPFASPAAPIMPTTSGSGGFSFDQAGTVLIGNETFRGGFYDPDVAVGYIYEAGDAATLFSKVMIPNSYGDGKFALFLWDESIGEFVDSGEILTSGAWFDFSAFGLGSGVTKFSIRGIETTAYVNPNQANAFVTGLVFGGTGNAFTMTAMTEFVEAPVGSVPEPHTYAMLLAGLGMIGALAKKRGIKDCSSVVRMN